MADAEREQAAEALNDEIESVEVTADDIVKTDQGFKLSTEVRQQIISSDDEGGGD